MTLVHYVGSQDERIHFEKRLTPVPGARTYKVRAYMGGTGTWQILVGGLYETYFQIMEV